MNQAAENELPPDVLSGATLRGNEFGWTVASFPRALQKAESHQLACIGGQFQFRVDDGTCEMYWLESNSSERRTGESWADYCHRSCSEVRRGFDKLVENTDFVKEASERPLLKAKIAENVDVLSALVFVAYFVTESNCATESKTTLPNSK